MEQRNTAACREGEAPVLRIDRVEDAVLPTEWDGQSELAGPGQPDYPGFCIRDDDVADWAVGKIAEARREYIRIRELADREIARIEAKVEQARMRMEADTAYLTNRLEDYAAGVQPSKVTKTGTQYKLINGTLRRRFGGVEYHRDDEALLRWLQETGRADLIKLKASPDWAGLKKQTEVNEDGIVVIPETGEVVEGVTADRRPDTFEVEIATATAPGEGSI